MKDEEYLKKLGQRIAQIRRELGKTQGEVAVSADIDRSYYARIEKGRINCSICMVRQIASSLDVNISELVKV